MINKITYTLTGYLAFILFTLSACAQKKQENALSAPLPYTIDQPKKFELPAILDEISGITFNQGNPDIIYAQQDEDGSIFYFSPGDKKTNEKSILKPGDYEDITILRQNIFILRSDGSLYSIPLKDLNKPGIDPKKWDNLVPKGEYEGLAGDEKDGKLLILCKSCKDDKKSGATSGYIFKLDNDQNVIPNGKFAIRHEQIEKFSALNKKSFSPSALALNQLTNEWYILSSVNKMLVITDTEWNVTSVHPLNRSMFPQPEGIAFDLHHNLYISNEADLPINGANILKFRPSPQQ